MSDLELPAQVFTGSPDPLLEREWLVTNGLGAFASATLAGAGTRSYHGLLVAAHPPPNARWVLVSGADEFLQHGDSPEVPLSTQEYEGGVLHPHGYAHLAAFALRGQRPVWRFDTDQGSLEKTVWMERGRNRTFLRYANHSGQAVRVRVRPFRRPALVPRPAPRRRPVLRDAADRPRLAIRPCRWRRSLRPSRR